MMFRRAEWSGGMPVYGMSLDKALWIAHYGVQSVNL